MTKYKILLALFAIALGITLSNKSLAAGATHPAGTLLLSSGTVYKVSDDGNSLWSFDTEARFLSYHYSFADAVPMNSADKTLPNSGLAPMGDNSRYVLDSGTVWQVQDTQRLAISEPGVLFSWGRKFSDVIPATVQDMQKPSGGLLKFRIGALVNDQGTVWVINANGKQSFASAECFTNFGFNFGKLLVGNTSNYQNLGGICGPMPTNTYAKQTVQTSRGNFSVDVMTFNLADTKVITDSANTTDCITNCPVKSLMSYVTDNSGFAAINGTYFCPTDYPDCANKTNSFYWKIFNSKSGTMINANNGIKEDVPFIGFNNSETRFYSTYKAYKDSGWQITAGINHEPGLVNNKQIILNESSIDEKERTVKSNRGSLGIKGQTVYAVIAHSATVPDMAAIMQTLGVDSAVNLDGGGSSSMIYDNAYKVGPGRNLPNAIIFAHK